MEKARAAFAPDLNSVTPKVKTRVDSFQKVREKLAFKEKIKSTQQTLGMTFGKAEAETL